MTSENFAECRLEQVHRRMVTCNCSSSFGIDFGMRLTERNFSAYQFADVNSLVVDCFLCIVDFENAFFRFDETGITDLTAGFGIERSLRKDDCSFFSLTADNRLKLAVLDYRKYFGVAFRHFISAKFGNKVFVNKVAVFVAPAEIAESCSCIAGFLFLLLHEGSETVLVDLNTFFLCKLASQVDREAERIIELEYVCAG